MSAPVLSWRIEWRSPDATGRKVFRSETYTDRNRMWAAVAEVLERPGVTQLSVVELPTEYCRDGCGLIQPDCENDR